MKKLIILPLVALILLGCSQPNTQQEADSKILQDENLKKFREMVRNALPNSDLVQFHQQEGECGEVSFRDKSTNEMKHRRFIVVNKNIVLIERRQIDQEYFDLSWRNACRDYFG